MYLFSVLANFLEVVSFVQMHFLSFFSPNSAVPQVRNVQMRLVEPCKV